MNDEALTPFVDALSASLIIMILIAISFILQNAIAINASAKEFVDVQVKDNDYNPITFRPALKVDIESREILFLVNFDLDNNVDSSLLVNTSILLIGARIMVAASGVGRPFSSRAETSASPIPKDVKTFVVS